MSFGSPLPPLAPGLAAYLRGAERPSEPAPGAFHVPILTEAAALGLLHSLMGRRAAARAAGQVEVAPNSMHDHGFVLSDPELEPWLRSLREEVVAPLARRWIEAPLRGDLDGHHAYLVEYGRHLDQDLGFHVDDSEITLNLCLGEDFDGSELTLLGRRCDLHRQDPVRQGECVSIEHRPGWGVLHAGNHRHRVEPIRRGVRRNLILWCRQTALVRPPSAPPGAWCGTCAAGDGD